MLRTTAGIRCSYCTAMLPGCNLFSPDTFSHPHPPPHLTSATGRGIDTQLLRTPPPLPTHFSCICEWAGGGVWTRNNLSTQHFFSGGDSWLAKVRPQLILRTLASSSRDRHAGTDQGYVFF